MTARDVARYWTKVDVRGEDECWPWMGGMFDYGYGAFWVDGQNRGAHRVGYCLAHTLPVSAPVVVRHSCDNPICQNPAHLLDGTQADNMADMAARGRSVRGERNPKAQLTAGQVVEICTAYSTGTVSQRALAEQYGVDHATIGRALRGLTWASVETPDMSDALAVRKRGEAKANRGEAAGMARLKDDDVREIKRRYAAGGVTQQQLADEFKVDRTNIGSIVRGKTWRHLGEPAPKEEPEN